MSWFGNRLESVEDSVLLIDPEREYHLVEVEWFCGTPYATMIRARCRLLPGGKVDGKSYIKGWEPGTPAMKEFYDHG